MARSVVNFRRAPRQLRAVRMASAPMHVPTGGDARPGAGHPGENLFTPEEWIWLARNLRLTSRELSVAILVLEGRTRADIAGRLGLSVETVRTFIDRMHKKLRVKDRLGLALRIVQAHRVLAPAAGMGHVPPTGDLRVPAGAFE